MGVGNFDLRRVSRQHFNGAGLVFLVFPFWCGTTTIREKEEHTSTIVRAESLDWGGGGGSRWLAGAWAYDAVPLIRLARERHDIASVRTRKTGIIGKAFDKSY